jgi:23S rRNA (cytidine1920-2'-O)/16S rRNA (cytidine1409-2'-O)-methyltransferase
MDKQGRKSSGAAAKRRADLLLVERGLASSRQKAQALIMAGRVYIGMDRVAKPGPP